MAISAIRTVIIYAYIILAMRIMGKRQLGELQPSELVVTLMISDLAAVPMQDSSIPLLAGIIPIAILMALELILSGVSLKFPAFERLLSGNPIPVIRDGVLDVKALKKLRLSVEDLCEMLRAQQIFDITTVQYAIIETGGQLSYYLKPSAQPATCRDIGSLPPDNGIPVLLISDGAVLTHNLALCNADRRWLDRVLQKKRLSPQDVLLMTADKAHNCHIIGKSGVEL